MTTVCQSGQARQTRGFTLIEVLVAIAIFVVMSVMAYGGLRVVLDARQSYEQNNDRLAELQTFFLLVARDIEQAVDRPIRDNFGDRRAALVGESGGFELTRAGLRNPAGFPRSHLQRVAYLVEDGLLLRLAWPVVDRAQDSEPVRSVLLEQIDAMEIRFLDSDSKWQSKWPVDRLTDERVTSLPRAIEVQIEYADWGRLTRLFALPLSVDDENKDEQA